MGWLDKSRRVLHGKAVEAGSVVFNLAPIKGQQILTLHTDARQEWDKCTPPNSKLPRSAVPIMLKKEVIRCIPSKKKINPTTDPTKRDNQGRPAPDTSKKEIDAPTDFVKCDNQGSPAPSIPDMCYVWPASDRQLGDDKSTMYGKYQAHGRGRWARFFCTKTNRRGPFIYKRAIIKLNKRLGWTRALVLNFKVRARQIFAVVVPWLLEGGCYTTDGEVIPVKERGAKAGWDLDTYEVPFSDILQQEKALSEKQFQALKSVGTKPKPIPKLKPVKPVKPKKNSPKKTSPKKGSTKKRGRSSLCVDQSCFAKKRTRNYSPPATNPEIVQLRKDLKNALEREKYRLEQTEKFKTQVKNLKLELKTLGAEKHTLEVSLAEAKAELKLRRQLEVEKNAEKKVRFGIQNKSESSSSSSSSDSDSSEVRRTSSSAMSLYPGQQHYPQAYNPYQGYPNSQAQFQHNPQVYQGFVGNPQVHPSQQGFRMYRQHTHAQVVVSPPPKKKKRKHKKKKKKKRSK